MEQLSDAIWSHETTFRPLDERQRLEPLYLGLDVEQAHRLALRAIDALERLAPRTEENKWAAETPIEVLSRVACFAPDALTGLHGRLLDAEAHRWSGFYQGEQAVIFKNADTAVRDRLIAIADTSSDYYEMSAAMHALAWIADDVVCDRFLTWTDREGMSPGWWALHGGWQLEARPPPRRLTADHSYRLEPVTGESPVRVMVPEDQRCRRCNTVLVALSTSTSPMPASAALSGEPASGCSPASAAAWSPLSSPPSTATAVPAGATSTSPGRDGAKGTSAGFLSRSGWDVPSGPHTRRWPSKITGHSCSGAPHGSSRPSIRNAPGARS